MPARANQFFVEKLEPVDQNGQRELPLLTFTGIGGDRGSELRIAEQFGDSIREPSNVARFDQEAVDAVGDQIRNTTDSGRDQRLLERDASFVVRATDAFAHGYRERFRPDHDRSPSSACLFVPVIVTNAPLYTARYRPADVSLQTGEFVETPKDIESATCVRFRKAFTSDGGPDLGDRSVFVVNATSFVEFLDLVVAAPVQPDDRAQVHSFRASRH